MLPSRPQRRQAAVQCINEKGEVIGVSVANFKEGQNLNFAVPSIYLKELLNKSGPLMPLAQAKVQNSVLAVVGGGQGVVGKSLLGI
jgi:hypothetical protein